MGRSSKGIDLEPTRIIIAGVSSSGKSTVAKALAGRLEARYLDADDFHPPANVDKMAKGVPLDDEDRWPWLDRLNAELRQAAARDETVVLACSALKVAYRERLAAGVDNLRLVLLSGRRELLAARAAKRKHRYMPASLLDSQLATLEPLAPGSGWEIDVTPPVDEIVDDLARRLAA
jgi:carbohydrate kinase (thermoresistant glucokinase family)